VDTRRTQIWGKGVHLKLELEETWGMVLLLQPPFSHLCKQEIKEREQNFGGPKKCKDVHKKQKIVKHINMGCK
jgi:hypothetical protein